MRSSITVTRTVSVVLESRRSNTTIAELRRALNATAAAAKQAAPERTLDDWFVHVSAERVGTYSNAERLEIEATWKERRP